MTVATATAFLLIVVFAEISLKSADITHFIQMDNSVTWKHSIDVIYPLIVSTYNNV